MEQGGFNGYPHHRVSPQPTSSFASSSGMTMIPVNNGNLNNGSNNMNMMPDNLNNATNNMNMMSGNLNNGNNNNNNNSAATDDNNNNINIIDCGVREQDRFMPIANVIRIMRKILPAHAKIADDAKETIQECVSEFISFITGEANERCQREQRKTITAEDILWAMSKLGFDDYIEPLTLYLNRYREFEGDRGSIRGTDPILKRTLEMGSSSLGGVLGYPPYHFIPQQAFYGTPPGAAFGQGFLRDGPMTGGPSQAPAASANGGAAGMTNGGAAGMTAFHDPYGQCEK